MGDLVSTLQKKICALLLEVAPEGLWVIREEGLTGSGPNPTDQESYRLTSGIFPTSEEAHEALNGLKKKARAKLPPGQEDSWREEKDGFSFLGWDLAEEGCSIRWIKPAEYSGLADSLLREVC